MERDHEGGSAGDGRPRRGREGAEERVSPAPEQQQMVRDSEQAGAGVEGTGTPPSKGSGTRSGGMRRAPIKCPRKRRRTAPDSGASGRSGSAVADHAGARKGSFGAEVRVNSVPSDH